MIIFLAILLFIIIVSILVMEMNANKYAKIFSHSNTLVFGKKRKGKDLFFQKMINTRKKPYLSHPQSYGGKYNPITPNEISLAPNTFQDLIHGTVTKIPKDWKKEKHDIYMSDGHISFPSQYQGELVKRYPSMPLYTGTQGHLYDSNMHINYNGSYTRLWDKLREQADEYFRVLGTLKLPFVLIVKIRHFEEEQAAKQNLLPFLKGIMTGQATRSLKKQFDATNGKITDFRIIIRKKSIVYDTRYWEKFFFTKESLTPPLEKSTKKAKRFLARKPSAPRK